MKKQLPLRRPSDSLSAAPASYPIAVFAEIVDPGSAGLPADDCRLSNDRFTNRTTWKVVTTDPNFSLLWAKVGSLLDIGNYTPDSHFDEIFELGTGYIRAVYPLIGPISTQLSLDIPPPPVTAAADFAGLDSQLVRLARRCGRAGGPDVRVEWRRGAAAPEPADGRAAEQGLVPAILVVERRHRILARRVHAAGGDFSAARRKRHTVGPPMTLPAHELGPHVRTQRRFPTQNQLGLRHRLARRRPRRLRPCRRIRRVQPQDPDLQDGNPASGYWVRRGERAAAAGDAGRSRAMRLALSHGEFAGQCARKLGGDGRWIDPADYDHLIDKLVIHPDPEVVYVSGMISWHNQIYLGRCVRLDAGVPDHSAEGACTAFASSTGRDGSSSEVGLPVAWNHAEFERVMPVTFFGVTLELPNRRPSWRSGIAARARDSPRRARPQRAGGSRVRRTAASRRFACGGGRATTRDRR